MHRVSFSRALLVTLVCISTLTLAGCGDKLEGTYHDANGGFTLTLKDGKATLTMMGHAETYDYKADKTSVTIINPKEGNLVLTRNADGTLAGQIMGTLTKNKS